MRVSSHSQEVFLTAPPLRIIMKEEFLNYYGVKSISGEDTPLPASESLLLKTLNMLQKEEEKSHIKPEEEQEEVNDLNNNKANIEEENKEDSEEPYEDGIINDDEDIDALDDNDNNELNEEVGSLLSVNATRVSDNFKLSSPPSDIFLTTLFDFQKQALTWMLYREQAIEISGACNISEDHHPSHHRGELD